MNKIWITLAMVFALVTSVPGFSAVDVQAASSAKSDKAKAAQQLSSKVNINSADAAMLATVPGVGPKTADAIIAYRTANGKFKSVKDLVNVKGIGEKKLAKLAPFVNI